MKSVRVATRVYLIKDDKIVAIKYINKGEKTGFYDLPGGKTEDGESSLDCAIRESKEETGLIVSNLKYSGNLIIEYPERIFDFSVFISNIFEGEFKTIENNEIELIKISNLISQDKKFGCIKLLEEEYIERLLNCDNFKIRIFVDNNENITDIKVEK